MKHDLDRDTRADRTDRLSAVVCAAGMGLTVRPLFRASDCVAQHTARSASLSSRQIAWRSTPRGALLFRPSNCVAQHTARSASLSSIESRGAAHRAERFSFVRRIAWRSTLRGALLCGLTGLSVSVVAQTYPGPSTGTSTATFLSRFPPSPGVLPGGGWQFGTGTTFANPPPVRQWTNGIYGGVKTFQAVDLVTVAGRGGPLAISAASSIGMKEAALAVARCVIGANAVCAVGTAAALAYTAYRANAPGSVPGSTVGADALDYDPGKEPTTSEVKKWRCSSNQGFTYGDPVSACTATITPTQTYSAQCDSGESVTMRVVRTIFLTQLYANSAVVSLQEAYSRVTSPTGPCANQNGATVNTPNYGDPQAQSTTSTQCKGSIDPLDPQYNIPDGAAQGPDGKCPTGRYNHVPLSAEQAAGKVEQYPPSFPSAQWGDAVKDSIDAGGQQAPANINTSGPASQTGTPTTSTTTGPNGTTTTTETPTHSYTYNGPKVTVTTNTTTVNVTNNGGATTTTTTTTGSAPATPQDPKDFCTANPTRAGCMDIGTAPTDKVPTKSVPLTYATEDLGLPSGCPSPVTFQVPSGKTETISYTTMCDTMMRMKPIIVAAGALAALLIVLAALRTS